MKGANVQVKVRCAEIWRVLCLGLQ
jgi:hypothetical protein